MPEPTLIFPYGEAEGILNSKIAQKQKSSHAEQPVRELLQNSFDAADSIDRKANIHFVIEEVDINEMPLYNQYKREFNNIKNYWEGYKDVGMMARKEFDKITKALDSPKIKILSVIDNGIGFSRERIESLFGQDSNKGDYNNALGSYGQGHLTAYGLSHFRYVTYVGQYKDNNSLKTIYSGSVILAGQEEDGCSLGCRGRLLAKEPPDRRRIREYEYPDSSSLPGFLQKHYDKIEDTGSIVSIIGFDGDLDENFKYSIVSNFFMAMLNKKILVSITKDNKTTTLDENVIKAILEERQSHIYRKGGVILPGREIYKAYQIIQNKECLKEIELDEHNKVKCYISVDDEKPRVMAIFRGGMIISSNKNITLENELEKLPNMSERRAFSVLITLEQLDCPDFYSLIKGIEDPHHKELNIKNASQEDRERIKNYCDNLYEGIIKHVPELDTENFSLPILRLFSKSKIFHKKKKKIRKISIHPPGAGGSEEPKPSSNHKKKPRPQPKPRLGDYDFQGKRSYRINNDNNQVLIKIVLEKADNDKRLSVAIREDSGYDNNTRQTDNKALEITGYCIKRNSEIVKEENNKNTTLVYIDSILESNVDYLLTVRYKTPNNPQPVLEPSIAYGKPRK